MDEKCEEIRANTAALTADIDADLSQLNSNYCRFKKLFEKQIQALSNEKRIQRQLNDFLFSFLDLRSNENETANETIERYLNARREEMQLLRKTHEANLAVKEEMKEKIKSKKDQVASIKEKQRELKNSANEFAEEKFLHKHLGIAFKKSKNGLIGVILKQPKNEYSQESKGILKLMSFEKENSDEKDIKEEFWKCLEKGIH